MEKPINTQAGRQYWQASSADDDGMLGGVLSQQGFSSVSRVDLQGSRTFLARLGVGTKRGRKSLDCVLEGGAGIGRVTKGLLLNVAANVDIVEPIVKFTDQIKGHEGVRHIFNVGLEEWEPPAGVKYDLIWVQWCLSQLTDAQVVKYLDTCKRVVTSPSTLVVVKENISTSDGDIFHEEDDSVTRTDAKWRQLFTEADMVIVSTELQRGFPEGGGHALLPVRMYALRAKDSN